MMMKTVNVNERDVRWKSTTFMQIYCQKIIKEKFNKKLFSKYVPLCAKLPVPSIHPSIQSIFVYWLISANGPVWRI
jgi:hypothetical protein